MAFLKKRPLRCQQALKIKFEPRYLLCFSAVRETADSKCSYCARHNFPYIRGWMQMVIGTKWFIFLKQIIQWNTIPVMVVLYNCYTMHNNTHSVHKRLLKMWRDCILRLWPSRCVYPPPLSEANCPAFPPPGGPGPPASKMASFSPGSTHAPSSQFVTVIANIGQQSTVFERTLIHNQFVRENTDLFEQ